jgi:hypothetical protein
VVLVTLLSMVAFYCFIRPKVTFHLAAISAVLYAALPYHLIIDFYMRGALAEMTALAIVPLCFLSLQKLAGGWRGAAGFAVSYSARRIPARNRSESIARAGWCQSTARRRSGRNRRSCGRARRGGRTTARGPDRPARCTSRGAEPRTESPSEPTKSDPQRFDSAPILYNSHMLASTPLASTAPALLPGVSRQ